MTDEQRTSLRVLTSMAAGIVGPDGNFTGWGNERRAQVAFAVQLLILDALERIAGPVVASTVEPAKAEKPKQVHVPAPKRERKAEEPKNG